jgi:hypothetical protein
VSQESHRSQARIAHSSSTDAVSCFIGKQNVTLAAIAVIVVGIIRSIGGCKQAFAILASPGIGEAADREPRVLNEMLRSHPDNLSKVGWSWG